MEILINNKQEDIPVDEVFLKNIAEIALEKEGAGADAELSIALVSEDEIRELNAKYRGKDQPTDVLSFGSEPFAEGEQSREGMPVLLGDVIVCPAVAARQAKEYGQSFEQEMALLLVHGILHLLGYDHQEDAEAQQMEAREREILSQAFASPKKVQDTNDEK